MPAEFIIDLTPVVHIHAFSLKCKKQDLAPVVYVKCKKQDLAPVVYDLFLASPQVGKAIEVFLQGGAPADLLEIAAPEFPLPDEL